ncbi:MAG: glycosyltransferase [Rhizobiales bacterium]|nr:glycosyltransferase [Hyphomicrobiales bacterium]
MKRVAFAVPGDLATPTGGYVYDRRIVAELPKSGWQVDVVDIGASFPRASVAERATAHLQLAALPHGRLIVVDGLAFGVMPQSAEALNQTHRLVALVHHPLALETGVPEWEAAQFRASERLALSFVHRVITTSATTARLLVQNFAVPEDRISIVRPGNDRVPIPERFIRKSVNLLAVGSIVPRKGYDLLIAALGQIPDLPWRLVIAADPGAARALQAQIASLRLTGRVELAGVVSDERLAEFYADADLFVLPSRYEGYGMAYTEAIAHGLPVVGTTAGAIPEAVPRDAGVLVPPDNVSELTLTLMRLIGSPADRTRLNAGARAAAAALPTWDDAGRQFSQALDLVA